MMTNFCDVSTIWQVILLVLSVLTVITIIGACVISLKHKHRTHAKFGIGVGLLLLNCALYVLMQLDSRITGAAHSVHFPYVLLF